MFVFLCEELASERKDEDPPAGTQLVPGLSSDPDGGVQTLMSSTICTPSS